MCTRPIRQVSGVLTHPQGEHVTKPSNSVGSSPLAIITHSEFLAQTDPNPSDRMEELRKQRSLFPQNQEQYGFCKLELLLAIFPDCEEEAICRAESEASQREKQRWEPDKSSDILGTLGSSYVGSCCRNFQLQELTHALFCLN